MNGTRKRHETRAQDFNDIESITGLLKKESLLTCRGK